MILADGQDVRDLLPADDDRIRLVHLAECVSIGEKRNLGCELARGEVICHWDDDDFSMPDRITEQLDQLVSSGLAVGGYHSIRFTDGRQWWQYIGDRSYALGTSLCYRRDWWQTHRFPGLQVAEDNAFVQMALQSRQLITTDGTHMMYATNHEGNTSPRLPGDNWRPL